MNPSQRIRTVAIVQARMGSHRLPGKVLAEIAGRPILRHVLERVARAGRLDGLVLATTTRREDGVLADLGAACGAEVFRGSSEDVLDRYYRAARLHAADWIVRVTADCPLVSPQLVEETIAAAWLTGADYTSNSRPVSTYPEGLDVEVFRFSALERAWRDAVLPSEREHVTPYLWKRPGEFTLHQLRCPETLPRVRLTVDEPVDLEFMRALYGMVPAGEMDWRDLARWAAAHGAGLPCNTTVGRDAGYFGSVEADPRLPPAPREGAAACFGPGRVVAVVQARTGATRLPGKTVAEICGKPLIEHIFERVRASRSVDEVVLATTTEPADRELLRIAARCGIAACAGSTADVLDRYCGAARRFHADTVVRITADDPFKDPGVIDDIVARFAAGQPLDYASNTIEPTYPEGLDVEVFSRAALETAWREATLRSDREHVTPYIWRQPERFRLASVKLDRDLSGLRWTLDYDQDLRFAREVYRRLYRGQVFGMEEILGLLGREPELACLNAGIPRNAGYLLSLERDSG